MAYPIVLKRVVDTVKSLHMAGVRFDRGTTISHKKIYSLTTASLLAPGKLEGRKLSVDWKLAWRNAKRLPPLLEDLMFRINHDILPTKARLKRMDRDQGTCTLCQRETEDLLQLFLRCPAREELLQAVELSLQPLNILAEDTDKVLHLALQPGPHCTVLAKYFLFVWEHKTQNLTREMLNSCLK